MFTPFFFYWVKECSHHKYILEIVIRSCDDFFMNVEKKVGQKSL